MRAAHDQASDLCGTPKSQSGREGDFERFWLLFQEFGRGRIAFFDAELETFPISHSLLLALDVSSHEVLYLAYNLILIFDQDNPRWCRSLEGYSGI